MVTVETPELAFIVAIEQTRARVAEGEELTAQMMGTNAGLHADQTRRHVREANHHLTS